MKKSHLLTLAVFAFLAFAAANAVAQQSSEGTAPVHVVVTVEAHKGGETPVINREDVMVHEGHDRDQVIDWVPAQGEHALLELMIMLDDGSNITLGTQLEDLRKFINAQPDTTTIGVAYMRDGTAQVVQNLTSDHALAAKALRLPLGTSGANGSPYFSLTDLVKRWPPTTARRAVIMATDGIDRFYGTGDLQDPYLDEAVDDALRAGITVSAIYTPSVGHFGHSYWQTYWGQIYLSQVADETGGEAYYIGFTGPPVSFTPFLDDAGKRLAHQYVLTFLPKPQKKAGWQRIRLMTEVPNTDLVAPKKVWVAAQTRPSNPLACSCLQLFLNLSEIDAVLLGHSCDGCIVSRTASFAGLKILWTASFVYSDENLHLNTKQFGARQSSSSRELFS